MINRKEKKTILVLAPHTDDAELGCGGSMARLIADGHDVYCLTFSSCTQSLKNNLPADTLSREVVTAMKTLCLADGHLIMLDFQVRTFAKYRQEILDNMIRIREDIRPDIVFMPAVTDLHQDHQVVHNEGMRAFKFSTILCYEMPWNNITFTHTAFIALSENDISKKVDAMAKYLSQSHRPYMSRDFILGLARTRGVQINKPLAEAFEIKRLIL